MAKRDTDDVFVPASVRGRRVDRQRDPGRLGNGALHHSASADDVQASTSTARVWADGRTVRWECVVDVTVTFVGNATTLISAGGVTVLTDPNFLHQGQRAYLGYGLVSKRLHAPALTIDELPPLDVIVLSHMHGDHWDRVAERDLDHGLPVVTTPHAAKRLRHRGFDSALGLTTWTGHDITKDGTTLRITSLPGRHAPGWTRRLLPPVMGSMLEFGTADGSDRRRLYVSGDTLLIDELRE